MIRKVCVVLLGLLFIGCAGMTRGCASGCASTYGADWIVVQYDMEGRPYRCWELHDVSVANEEHSDGIYWLSSDGHLVHISNNYNRIQVTRSEWDSAFVEAGLTREECASLTGRRPAER